ncbi:MAG: hypothetical protein COW03_09300 [Cytophagales bacterium CG12_big_fil_rev_8_21_14_0_65_40_12]|nr:MAG: hypothetical protein COW03_09300 [Cytophagales bacterium CG12_big_fil_rev_8_21_14_0_65_40_12]PIW02786.1 MAG: hypothetical protein COW40_18200 [Cytophagales bacterium CG17_big_fil_post_rev_8_21_14_2_50_40_13]
MKINILSKKEFLNSVYNNTEDFIERIEKPEAFIVKRFYNEDVITQIRNRTFENGQKSEPSWHPCFDGCPDFHRIHNNYPNAHVKAIMHAYYHHGYYESNDDLFEYFSEIFDIKNFLAGTPKGSYIKNIPSEFFIARVNIHNYPRGGGYQMPHVDPVSKFAKIQTIVQASKWQSDFSSGGVYACLEKDGTRFYIDPHTEVGDLIVLSPNIIHGVEEIDKEETIDWEINSGRWMIMPIIIHSDYESNMNVKPKEVL